MTKLRLWIALKVLGTPEFHCGDEALRLYDRIWPKHIATKDATIRTMTLFMMRQRISERLNHCHRKRYRT